MNSHARILIVDDEPQIRRVMMTSLAANGYQAFEARSGEAALAALRENAPDLILLDLNMPGMGGMAACREIRAVSEVAIIVLSVRDGEKDKIAALDAGADDYLTKPFSVNELLARIRANLRRSGQSEQEEPPFVSEHLTVDFSSRQVTANGNPVRLTPKEFEFLIMVKKSNTCASLSASCARRLRPIPRTRATLLQSPGLAIGLWLRQRYDSSGQVEDFLRLRSRCRQDLPDVGGGAESKEPRHRRSYRLL